MASAVTYLKRAALVVLAAAVVVAGTGYFTLRASLPRLDGEMRIAGLSSPVTVERDAAGVPTIHGASQADVTRAVGFLHAQERYFQMDLLRRVSAGELSELVGAGALEVDRKHRVHRFRTVAREVVARLNAEQRALLQAYADGVNAGLAALGARPFEYWLLGVAPTPWQPEDSLLVAYTMYLDLQAADGHMQLQRERIKSALPPSAYRFVYGAVPEWESTLDGSRSPAAVVPSAAEYDLRAQQGLDTSLPESVRRDLAIVGSNNWAVSGTRTATGAALVANDMHLGFRVPNIWYRTRLVTGEGAASQDVTGVTLPGNPAIVAGSNGHIAWGFTNSYGEYQTLVRLHPVEGRAGFYATASGAEALREVTEEIRVHGAPSVSLTITESRFGPVIAHDADGTPVALAWTAHDPDATNLGIARLAATRTAAEALNLAPLTGMPGQNLAVGDADGHIGWTIIGRLPRHAPTGNLPQESTDPNAGLLGWLDPADYPRVMDPDDGMVWTANTHVLGGHGGELIGDLGSDRGARAHQIHDDLAALKVVAPKDSLGVQLDDRAVFLTRWKDLLAGTINDAAIKASPARAAARDVLGRWSGHAAVDDPAYRLVRRFRDEVEARVWYALIAPARARDAQYNFSIPEAFEGPLWTVVSERPMHLLPAVYADWDALLLEALDAAAVLPPGCATLAGCTWGVVHPTRVSHPLSKAVPALAGALDMPTQMIPGDENMPRVIAGTYGASERFSVSPGHEAEAYFHMPGAQSGNPLSPYYRVGFEAWVHGEPTPFLPGPRRYAMTLAPAVR